MRTKILRVSPERPTEASLLVEAERLGSGASTLRVHAGDLHADSADLLRARGDAGELEARGYLVSDAHYQRVSLLDSMLVPLAARQSQLEVEKDLALERAEQTRTRLLAIRARLARIGVAVGHPHALFSLGTRTTMRLNLVASGMELVIQNIEQLGAAMPDHATVTALLDEARALVAGAKSLRFRCDALRFELAATARRGTQVYRLLHDTLMHLSSQGLAAFGDDPRRSAPYALSHLRAAKAREQKPEPPDSPSS